MNQWVCHTDGSGCSSWIHEDLVCCTSTRHCGTSLLWIVAGGGVLQGSDRADLIPSSTAEF